MSALPKRKSDAAPAGGTPRPGATPSFVVYDGGAGGGVPREPIDRAALAKLGILIAVSSLAMFFLSLLSAFVVRSGLGGEWGSFPLPKILYFNTAVLVVSSITMEIARRRAAGKNRGLIWVSFALGVVFLTGQIVAWRQLLGSGLSVGETPYTSYLYLLTGAHAAHVAGGLLALAAAAISRRANIVTTSAIYWHFMTLVWIGLFNFLAFWR